MHNHHKKKIQFILKYRENQWSECPWNPDEPYAEQLSSGLCNSVQFITQMIAHRFGDCTLDLAHVIDGHGIDREVTRFRPDIVIIEAIWVPPYKFHELTRLHPKVNWVIRLHSEVPFLANEGIAMDWLCQYLEHPRVRIAANSERMARELGLILEHSVIHLPNCYEIQ
jgi:hypothetical protein